ncbi:MAG: short chain dehydrogenase [Deltaproteobacteria bacterium]|nr:short chain dehydrogenase [Deltaproteobacteria bacterium]
MRGEVRELRGRAVVITGAAGGIGTCLAREFAVEGAKVALLDLDRGRLESVAGSLANFVDGSRRAPEVLSLVCDLTDPSACERSIGAVIAEWGGVDVLVNNAGISHRSLFRDTDLAVIHKVVAVNLFGTVHCTRAAIESIVERRGAIVAISSVAGFAPLVGRTAYSASKHALHGLCESLRAELHGSGVDVTMVCPGFVDTRMDTRVLAGDGGPPVRPKTVIGNPSDPEDVARQIVRAVARRRRLLVISAVGKMSLWLSRLAPALYERVMRRAQAVEMAADAGGECGGL